VIAYLRKGEPVIVMGPTGAPTEIPTGRACCCSAAALATPSSSRSRKAMKEHGNRVIYFAGYKRGEDLFKREEIEAATDQVTGAPTSARQSRRAGRRTRISAATSCRRCRLPQRRARRSAVPPADVDRIIAIGSDRMMAAVKAARHSVLAAHLKPNHVGIASINSPMQCMMKEVCAHVPAEAVDPHTGKRRSSSPASIRIRRWTASTSRICPHGSGRTPFRKSSRTCGSINLAPRASLPRV